MHFARFVQSVAHCTHLNTSDRNNIASVSMFQLNIYHAKALLNPHDFGLRFDFAILSYSTDFVSECYSS